MCILHITLYKLSKILLESYSKLTIWCQEDQDKPSLSVSLVLTVQETRYQLAVRENAVLELMMVYHTMMEGPALSV